MFCHYIPSPPVSLVILVRTQISLAHKLQYCMSSPGQSLASSCQSVLYTQECTHTHRNSLLTIPFLQTKTATKLETTCVKAPGERFTTDTLPSLLLRQVASMLTNPQNNIASQRERESGGSLSMTSHHLKSLVSI